jgi:hypothetical protein
MKMKKGCRAGFYLGSVSVVVGVFFVFLIRPVRGNWAWSVQVSAANGFEN